MRRQAELGTSNRKNSVSNNMQKVTRNTINKLLAIDKPNLIVTLSLKNLVVDANPEVYDKNDLKRMKEIVKKMSNEIIIDRTYVKFQGNRWKGAFLVEEKWYEFIKLILATDFGKKCKKSTNDMITETLIAISMTYLYDILEKYGYEISDVEISIPDKFKFTAQYEIDDRTSWNQ